MGNSLNEKNQTLPVYNTFSYAWTLLFKTGMECTFIHMYVFGLIELCIKNQNSGLYQEEKVFSIFLVFKNSSNSTEIHEAKMHGTLL